jgi:hypothetical protein
MAALIRNKYKRDLWHYQCTFDTRAHLAIQHIKESLGLTDSKILQYICEQYLDLERLDNYGERTTEGAVPVSR